LGGKDGVSIYAAFSGRRRGQKTTGKDGFKTQNTDIRRSKPLATGREAFIDWVADSKKNHSLREPPREFWSEGKEEETSTNEAGRN
jgi:hypothetical protein